MFSRCEVYQGAAILRKDVVLLRGLSRENYPAFPNGLF
jgi:hypothetical protein